MCMAMAAIGLGANLPSAAGTPAQTIAAAIERLNALGKVRAQSSMYRTAPVGYLDQPEFVNAAALLETSLAPLPLLEAMLRIERSFGRDRTKTPAKGPRTLDLDLLLYGNLVLRDPMLTLPHPAIHERRFVLAPLAEIAREWRHPVIDRSIGELLAALPAEDGAVVKADPDEASRITK
jgi:2-amino-4-hydroxy-6-hydroxymethyldihydropteridine diphosphokinase